MSPSTIGQTLAVRCGMLTAAAADQGGISELAIEITMNRSEQMADRAAIVTGASSGIGYAIARMLGQEGYCADARRAPAREAAGGCG